MSRKPDVALKKDWEESLIMLRTVENASSYLKKYASERKEPTFSSSNLGVAFEWNQNATALGYLEAMRKLESYSHADKCVSINRADVEKWRKKLKEMEEIAKGANIQTWK